MELRWTFAHENTKYKAVLIDYDADIFHAIYDPEFRSSDLGVILQACYYLNGNYWHPALTARQLRILEDIKKVSQKISKDYAASLKTGCS